jgi:hypothetical protein
MNDFAATRAEGFRDVLRFEEDNPGIFNYTLPQSGIPYWLVVRWPLCRMLEDKVTGSSTLEIEPKPYRKVPAWLFRSVMRNPFRARSKASDILIVGTAVGNYRLGGVYVNRLVDHFARCYPDRTTITERSNKFEYYFPRSFPRVYCHDSLTLVGEFLGKFRKTSSKDSRRIGGFVEGMQKGFDFALDASRAQVLTRILEKAVLGDSATLLVYSKLLEKLKPRVILVEDGCYGGLSTLIVAARDRGILVAEHQHGLISKNHEAYNYNPAVHEELSRFLPEVYLSWGSWWGRQMSVPCEVRVVGNPHLNESIARKQGSGRHTTPGPKPTFLFISGAMNPARYETFMLSLSAALDGRYRIVFRPHPRERNRINADYPGLLASDCVEIDANLNLYESLAEADAVGGDMSTGTVEAMAFGVPVYLLDSENTRRHLPEHFRYVATGAELAKILPTSDFQTDLDRDDVWAPDWEQNYRRFIEEALAR